MNFFGYQRLKKMSNKIYDENWKSKLRFQHIFSSSLKITSFLF